MANKKTKKKNVRLPPKKQSISFRRILRVLKFSCIAIVSCSAIAVSGYYGVQAINQFLSKPIAQVIVEGNFEYVQKDSLEKMIGQHIKGSFIREDLLQLQKKIQSNPWVDKAMLRRQWPDQLYVTIREQRPIARWGDKGFVNHRGELVQVKDNQFMSHLPTLRGNDKHALLIMKQYQLLSEAVALYGVNILELEENHLGIWSLHLDNGWKLLAGRTEVIKKVQRVMQMLANNKIPRQNEIRVIDMRYQNGLAIEWKAEEQHAKSPSTDRAQKI